MISITGPGRKSASAAVTPTGPEPGPPPPYNRVRRPGYAVAMRVAAIDCGTNSLRLLVADVDPATGSLHDVTREMVVVRLGEGVDRTGVFAPEALERTFAVVDAYAETCRALGAEAIRFVATSASRDVLNREEFASGIESRIGVSPDVISGHEEASLSFVGATANVAERRAGPFLVVDLGGGSTELAPLPAWIGQLRRAHRGLPARAPRGFPYRCRAA